MDLGNVPWSGLSAENCHPPHDRGCKWLLLLCYYSDYNASIACRTALLHPKLLGFFFHKLLWKHTTQRCSDTLRWALTNVFVQMENKNGRDGTRWGRGQAFGKVKFFHTKSIFPGRGFGVWLDCRVQTGKGRTESVYKAGGIIAVMNQKNQSWCSTGG